MFIRRIKIQNFKSLKDIDICPAGLMTLVGPNGAGKTNFTLALQFLAEVYQYGLETAIARAGGIENIAFRRARRTRSPISFTIEIAIPRGQMSDFLPLDKHPRVNAGLSFRHSFSFGTVGTGIRAEFQVKEESFTVLQELEEAKVNGWAILYRIERDSGGRCKVKRSSFFNKQLKEHLPHFLQPLISLLFNRENMPPTPPQSLYISFMEGWDILASATSAELSQIHTHHFSCDAMRLPGTPTPNPALSFPGEHLPALVDWLQRKHKRKWKSILNAMRDIIPELEDISVQVLSSKTLGLFFAERGVGRPWRIDEVSDGTAHALSILVACSDPRATALVIEEPENSVHPWILKELAKRLREISKEKTVIVTTHSPVFIDALHPHEVWIASRKKGCTSIENLTEIDPSVANDWEEGDVGLSEFLDSGLIPRSVPGGG